MIGEVLPRPNMAAEFRFILDHHNLQGPGTRESIEIPGAIVSGGIDMNEFQGPVRGDAKCIADDFGGEQRRVLRFIREAAGLNFGYLPERTWAVDSTTQGESGLIRQH
ncbi:MAG TPA: hypothetical protein VN664_01790 [Burkholderiales bacterium]|nr:hypothetical protein [Burkholderiales bacterium]